ncbi:hypothetical protein GEOBRER4_n0519 [Citrifermentans bremense]|uniref:Uncharacterized protein n=1 Tax=Citrifermentans bremense TaxID=60035 RepID=A0A7R7FRV3_9BACT|nr:hypothetical protein GEOBRER4_n0519 [Citrifermentans bremense]
MFLERILWLVIWRLLQVFWRYVHIIARGKLLYWFYLGVSILGFH